MAPTRAEFSDLPSRGRWVGREDAFLDATLPAEVQHPTPEETLSPDPIDL